MTMTKTKVCVNDDMLMDRPLDRGKKKSHARRRRGNLPIANRHLSFISFGFQHARSALDVTSSNTRTSNEMLKYQ